jgi:acetyl-CoA synthetase
MSSEIVWSPTRDYIEQTNLGRFMRRHGIADYRELIRRSIDDIAWYWDAVVADLPIDFAQPYHTTFESTRGIAWSRWFLGGTLNLAYNCVDRHAQGAAAARTAVLWEGEDGAARRLTYAELLAETNRIANALRSLGLGRGDRIGLVMPMLPETVVAFLAIAKLGAIVIPIFSGFGAEAVADRLRDCAASAVFTADGSLRRGHTLALKEVVDEAARLSPTVRHVIVYRRLGRPIPWIEGRDHWWHELASAASPDFATEIMDAEDPFMVAYTSGTTGRPKGSVHVHGGFLVKMAQETAYQADMRPDDVLFWVTDMGWIMGPWEVVGALTRGGTVFLFEGAPDYPGCDRLWSMIARHRISILGISPTLVRALMRHGEAPVHAHDLSSLRILASTGEPWNPDPWSWYFRNVGDGRLPIINISGGTEAGACFLSVLPIAPLKPCSLGGPSLGMAVDVFDPDGRPLRGGVGELVCTKPWPGMTRGLWGGDDRYLQTYWSRWPDVWLHGDWASIDADGFWFLHGRSDDTLKVSGKRLGPSEVESAVVAHPAAVECAAIGVPHDVKGEAIWCFVILHSGIEPSDTIRSEIRDRVVASLGKSFAPDQVRFVNDLPRTRSAKILRRAIRAFVLNEDPGDLTTLENPGAFDALRQSR